MTVRDRILAYLRDHPEGVDDDALAAALPLRRRQHANNECNKLAQMGLIQRRPVNGKTRNFLSASSNSAGNKKSASETDTIQATAEGTGWRSERPWFWEGNVQTVAKEFLRGEGYRIVRAANTAKKEKGKDIIAVSPSGQELWVTAKGQPEGTPRTTKYTQARHYFSDALRDLVSWRGQNDSVAIALVLPDFVTYRNSTRRFAAQLAQLRVFVVWVRQDRKVEVPPDLP